MQSSIENIVMIINNHRHWVAHEAVDMPLKQKTKTFLFVTISLIPDHCQ